jgi:hypothetical protein
MSCRVGHFETEVSEYNSMSRREILRASGLTALTVATAAGGAVLLSNCGDKEKKDYVPLFGMLVLHPPHIMKIEHANQKQLVKEECYIHIPFWNEHKIRLTKGMKVACQILIFGNPAAGALAVNLSPSDHHNEDYDNRLKYNVDVDNRLAKIGYRRPYQTSELYDLCGFKKDEAYKEIDLADEKRYLDELRGVQTQPGDVKKDSIR